MLYYRRRLPHWIPDEAVIFVTWRLAGSTPRCRTGPFWLQDARVAGMIQDTLRHGEARRNFYQLFAWVIMPDHVHVVFQPQVPMPSIMRWLKGRTGRLANRILGRTGFSFWQDESYDHWIRSPKELQNVIEYVESNPVKAGLVEAKQLWPWSSAY